MEFLLGLVWHTYWLSKQGFSTLGWLGSLQPLYRVKKCDTQPGDKDWKEPEQRREEINGSFPMDRFSVIVFSSISIHFFPPQPMSEGGRQLVLLAANGTHIVEAVQPQATKESAGLGSQIQQKVDPRFETHVEEANDMFHWDFSSWSKCLHEATFDINQEELRPFFSLPKVLNGSFGLAKTFFDIAPVWIKVVTLYVVKDSLGSPVIYFYFDPYSRPINKKGGVLMDEVFCQICVLAQDGSSIRLPIAHMVCNQTPPFKDDPSLLIFRQVETTFREFGHALQQMPVQLVEGLFAGIQDVEKGSIGGSHYVLFNNLYYEPADCGIFDYGFVGKFVFVKVVREDVRLLDCIQSDRIWRSLTRTIREQSLAKLKFSMGLVMT